MKRTLLALAIAACGLIGLVVILLDLFTFQANEYENCGAARADELFGPGWVPDVLPSACGPIIEAHDLDTNAWCSRSNFAPAAAAQVRISPGALGFTPHDGEVPETPFARCSFSSEQVRGTATLRRPGGGLLNDFEYAAVSNDGVLYFWSAHR